MTREQRKKHTRQNHINLAFSMYGVVAGMRRPVRASEICDLLGITAGKLAVVRKTYRDEVAHQVERVLVVDPPVGPRAAYMVFADIESAERYLGHGIDDIETRVRNKETVGKTYRREFGDTPQMRRLDELVSSLVDQGVLKPEYA